MRAENEILTSTSGNGGAGIAEGTTELEHARREAADLRRRLATSDQLRDWLKGQLRGLNGVLAELETEREDARRRVERAAAEAEAAKAEAATLQDAVQSLREEREWADERLAELGAEEERLRAGLDASRTLAEERAAAEQAALARVRELEVALAGAETAHDRLRGRTEELDADRGRLRDARDAALATAERRGAELKAARADAAAVSESLARTDEERRVLGARLDELEAEVERLGRERDDALAAAERRAGELEESRAEIARLRGTAEEAGAERASLAERLAELEREQQRLAADRDAWQAEAGNLAADRDAWRDEAQHVAADRSEWRDEAGRLAADRDNWRDEAGRLVVDRDNWRREATNWRRETERLMAIDERRLGSRLRRAAFRAARFLWWRLPRPLRDFLRPIIFRRARTGGRPAHAAPAGDGAPDEHGAGRGGADPARTTLQAVRETGPVSVLLPTLNAGPGFERLLAGLSSQVGVSAVEVVVVDSGSTDGTPERAAAAGARVERISPDEFGHGRTRNRAAELAAHDVLVPMVQDAVLLGPTALRDLVLELLADERLAGVSARQVPRSDADLYGAFVAAAHDEVLREARAMLNGDAFDALDPLGRRAVAALDSVCCALRRDAWSALRFHDVAFAEDLDFAVRAIRAGWRIGLSDTVAVAHSHDREAVYHLKRAVADRVHVAPLVGEGSNGSHRERTVREALAAGAALVEELAAAVSLVAADTPGPAGERLARAAAMLEAGAPRVAPATGELGRLAAYLAGELAGPPPKGVASLAPEMAALLRWPPLGRFAAAQPAVEPADLERFVARLSATVVGRAVGEAARGKDDASATARLLAGV